MIVQKKLIFLVVLLVLATFFVSACGKKEEPKVLVAEIGREAPDFSLTDLTGKTWKLSELKGKVVFVNFWATWCEPCREELPSMEALHRGMGDKPFQMLAVLSSDSAANAEMMIKITGSTFPILVDTDGSASRAYGLTGVPETYIIDPQGILREKFLGPRPWDSPAALDMLKKYMP